MLEGLQAEMAAIREVVAPNLCREIPTIDVFIEVALATATEATRGVYGPALYWYAAQVREDGERIGSLRVNVPTGHDLDVLVALRQVEALRDPRARHGRCAGEHLVGALRLLYRQAARANYLLTSSSPASDLKLPRRPKSTRRDLDADELRELFEFAIALAEDPELVETYLWLLRETAARRGGALSLRLGGLDHRRRTCHLIEKGREERDNPASRSLLVRLDSFARSRGASHPDDRVLRFRDGHPFSNRGVNCIFAAVQAELPWAEALGVSSHFIKHTTLTDIERVAGYRVAQAYGGHSVGAVTERYTHVSDEELLAAHDLIFGAD